jgi:hypothetical protein
MEWIAPVASAHSFYGSHGAVIYVPVNMVKVGFQ